MRRASQLLAGEAFLGLVQVTQEGDQELGMASRLYGFTNSEELYLETTPTPAPCSYLHEFLICKPDFWHYVISFIAFSLRGNALLPPTYCV